MHQRRLEEDLRGVLLGRQTAILPPEIGSKALADEPVGKHPDSRPNHRDRRLAFEIGALQGEALGVSEVVRVEARDQRRAARREPNIERRHQSAPTPAQEA
jgi:hypothetical protein